MDNIFQQFFVYEVTELTLLHGHHHLPLMALSVLIAIAASYFALHLVRSARVSAMRSIRQLPIISGALVLGSGVWAMHFIGMLAFRLPIPVHYHLGLTALSMLPSLLAAYCALILLARPSITKPRLLIGGVLVGAGIGAMHYIGMAAMIVDAHLRYQPAWFGVSIITAVLLAYLALCIHFGLRQNTRLSSSLVTMIAACVMGIAISGMHYIAMHAAVFVDTGVFSAVVVGRDTNQLVWGIVLVTFTIIVLVVILNALVLMNRLYRNSQESASRLQATFDTAVDGIICISEQGIVLTYNQAAERILGYSANEVIGHNVNMLMPHPHQRQHDQYLQNYKQTGKGSIIGVGREVEALHKNRHLVPIRLAIGESSVGDERTFVGFITDISQRKAMEQGLQQSESQYRTLVNNIPGVTFRCKYDSDWTMLYMSDKIEPLSGYPTSDFIHNQVRSYASVIHPDDRQMLEVEIQRAVRESRDWVLEYRIMHRDGSIHWAQEKGCAVRDRHGRIQHFDGFILDISEDKHNKLELERQLSAFRALNNISAISQVSPMERVQAALATASDYLGLTHGWLSQVNGEEYQVLSYHGSAESGLQAGLCMALQYTLCAEALEKKGLVAAADMDNSPFRDHPSRRQFPIKSYIGIPVRVHGRQFGTLCFASEQAREESFKETEKQFIRLLAKWVATTLELKMQNDTLERSESRLRGLFDLAPVGIALSDYETGAFIDFNAALLAPTGYSRDALLQLNLWDLAPNESAKANLRLFEQLDSTERYGPYEKTFYRQDGSSYPVLIQGVTVLDNSGRRLIWSIIEDISERKRNDELKNQFVSTVSHELRTPITSIKGSLELLLGGAAGQLPEKASKLIQVARNNSLRLSTLINDLLDLERLLAERMTFDLQTMPLRPVLLEIIERNEPFAHRHGAGLVLAECQDSLQVRIDKARFEQVITNLISNAVKFSPKSADVTIHAALEGSCVGIRVTDQGSGIPLEFQPRVFEKFAQASAGNTREQGGSGLGLAICKEITERMEGSIGFTSSAEGTAFYLLLPSGSD